jgi:hypothetical protein
MPGRRKSRSRSRRKKPKSPSPEADADSDVTGQAEDEEELSAEARISLLEVENATLKAENRELRKKLLEVLRRGSGKEAAASNGKRKEAPKDTKRSRKEDASPPRAPKKREEAPARQGREKKASKAEESDPEEDEGAMPAWASDGEGKEPPAEEKPNAVLLVNAAMEAYNESVPNNIPLEKRLPLVEAKMNRFLENFGDKVEIRDLESGGAIIKDRKVFTARYKCVFRESGAKLKCSTNKRFYYDASNEPTYSLDFEMHESLVTATPGTKPDGSLGCRPPRTEHLVVLYEEQKGKIARMWLSQDKDKVGQDAMAGEEIMKKLPIFKMFEKKIAELRGRNDTGDYFFNNYHNIPTVG